MVIISVYFGVLGVQELFGLLGVSSRGDLGSNSEVHFSKSSEESSSSGSWFKDTLGDSSPLVVGVAALTDMTFKICQSSSKESAVALSLVHVYVFTNDTSWESLLCELSIESWLHSLVEGSAFLSDSWFTWLDWYLFVISLPPSVFESIPRSFGVFVWESTMMPVASVVRPS